MKTSHVDHDDTNSFRIDTKKGRAALDARNGPYWYKLSKGGFLGLRKSPETSHCVWHARYRVSKGKPSFKSLGDLTGTFDFDHAKVAAESWFMELEQGVTGRNHAGVEATVETACRDYVNDRRREKGAGTANDAHRRFERTVYGDGKKKQPNIIAAVPLNKLRSSHMRNWRQALIDSGLSKGSTNRTQITFNAALNLAVAHKLVGIERASAWRDVKPFKGTGKRRDLFLDLAQRRALLAASVGALRHLVESCMLTGCRAGELVSARCRQFDIRTDTLSVSGKTGSRQVLLSEVAATFFAARTVNRKPDDFLLTRDDGKPWAHSDWDEHVRSAAAAAKLPVGTCLYTLRHSWITEALLGGMSTLEVARLAGTSVMMIEKHYGHLVANTARERLSKLSMV